MKTSLCVLLTSLACGAGLAAGTPPDAARILRTAPLRFEPAPEGSASAFVARGLRCRFSFTGNQVLFQAAGSQVRMRFEGAVPQARMEGMEKLRSTTSVFLGNDPTQWRTAIPNYCR